MKNLIFVITFLLFCFIHFQNTNAQWVQKYQSINNEQPVSMETDLSGNIYIAGYARYSNLTEDFVIIKYSSSGVLQWQKILDGQYHGQDRPYSIGLDDSGNVYVCGVIQFSANQFDNILIKYNNSGLEKWRRKFGSMGYFYLNHYYMNMEVDGDGDTYITARALSTGTSLLTIKYNTNGDSLWVNKLSSPATPTCLTVDDTGNVYVGGNLGDDILTIKYSTTGEQLWLRSFDGTGNTIDRANTIDVDDSGNVYVGGSKVGEGADGWFTTLKYDKSGLLLWERSYYAAWPTSTGVMLQAVDDSGNVYIYGQVDARSLTIKYNTLGTILWLRDFGGYGSYFKSIKLDASGNVYFTGSNVISFQIGYYEITTVKYSPSGFLIWSQSYGGSGEDVGNCLAIDSSGNVIVTGFFYETGFGLDIVTIKYQKILSLNLSALIEGFYDELTNSMVSDTVRVYMRNSKPPFSILDSSESILNSNGYGSFNFSYLNASTVYIVVKHRNTIETWSNIVNINSNPYSYDFTTSSNMAYGNNQLLKGIEYCIYSGDVNQDGYVDLDDLYKIYNDAVAGVSGYVNTDLNGDNITDLSDLTISFNNMNQFVMISKP